MNKKIKYTFLAVLLSLIFLIIFGSVTAIIPNKFFVRMVSITLYDKIFLFISSLLIGSYISVNYYKKNTKKQCNVIASSGGISSFFAYACPICNKFLVIIFGTSALLTYLEPIRPILGFISLGLLTGALYLRVKN